MKRNRKPGRRGASLVEFALGAMIFFMLYFGVMSWAWAFFQHQTITWRVSDAARWAAANRADDLNAIRNIIMCGSTAACGSTSNSFYTIGNIDIQHFSRSDQIDPTGTFPAVTRYYIRVTVQNYQIRHFIPGFSGTATGKPISSIQPMECQVSSGNCWNWN
jgi:Flp pilus assembly protein TadG